MGNRESASEREFTILSALVGGELYGREIRDEYERRTNAGMPLGSLYTTLDRMEGKGFVKSRMGESDRERGGNRRKYYKLTATGISAYNAFRTRMNSLVQGGANVKAI
jgi:PadR family transcriptional regulator, regulatory protein PadR